MRKLDHCNIVRLRYFFYSSGEKVRPQCVEESSTLTPPVCLPAFLVTAGLFPRYSSQTLPPPLPCSFLTMPHTSPLLSAERRALSKSGAGICARDGVPGGPPFYQGQVDHPYHLCQGRQGGRLLGPRPTKPGAPDRHSCLCGFPHLQVSHWSLEASRSLPLSLYPQRWSVPKAGQPNPRPDSIREAG